MKITDITLYPAPIPLNEPFVISLGPLNQAANLFVRLRTKEGITGWGEASPFPTIHGETVDGALAIGKMLGEQLLRYNPTDIEKIVKVMDDTVFGNSCIKSALEMACWDICAQAKQQPLYRLLGAVQQRQLTTDYTVSVGSPEDMVEKAKWIKTEGFPVVKVKVGKDKETDVKRILAIRSAIGPDLPLRLDANQGWTKDEALYVLKRVHGANIQLCEEPIDKRDWCDLASIRQQSPIAIFADESCWDDEDAKRLLACGAVDGFNVKLSKTGGFTKALRIYEQATTAGLSLQIGGFLETRLGFTAAAHFGVLPEVDYHDLDTPLMQTLDPIVGGIVYGDNGTVSLPDKPGLGAWPDPAYLAGLAAVNIGVTEP